MKLLSSRTFALVLAIFLYACGPAAPIPTPLPALVNTVAPVVNTPAAPLPAATATATAPDPTPAPTASPQPPPETPAGFDPAAYGLRQVYEGFTKPVFLTHAGDGSGRLFVVEQPGRIWVIRDGAVLPKPFLDIRDIVGDRANEQGLLGLAFHPDYGANGWFFVNYTDTRGDTVIARYTVSANPDQADPGSAAAVLRFDQPYGNHNGGDLAFGPGGYLYIGTGDGGSGGDPQGNGQRLDTLLGKLLRIDVSQLPYTIPADNPFVNTAGARPEIWAYGLRNPWRISFDRATGDVYIGDVGQNAVEEIDFQPADSPGGENYGWNYLEGTQAFAGQAPAGLVPPIAEYTHQDGCSVTGGYVYRGPALPGLRGVYLYGDYCSGKMWALYRADGGWRNVAFLEVPFNISSFGEDEAGEVYALDHRRGGVYLFVAAP